MELEQFNANRTSVTTPAGEIAYVAMGDGPVALFVHGVIMSSYLWGSAIEALAEERRCIALDLPVHGRTRIKPDQELTATAQAEVIEGFCEALGLEEFDMIANDTGGAVAQIFTARHRDRVRTLTLTNCDCHDQLPPAAFKQTVDAATVGMLAERIMQVHDNPDLGRIALAQGYEHPEKLDDDAIREFFGPFKSMEGARELERAITSLDSADLLAVEPELAKLDVPTLVAWGTGDIFFDLRWAHWLKDTIPGVEQVVEIPDAKLFWPDERTDELVPHLRAHISAHAAADPVS
jgi:pimeloyl-ACP methyl ester carboxylesterase